MKFEIGKKYRTRDGRKAQILILNNDNEYMLGAIRNKFKWFSFRWNFSGSAWGELLRPEDLVSEWRDPIKYSVELCGNEWHSNDFMTSSDTANRLFGVSRICNDKKSEFCKIKYRITVEEIPE